MMIYRYCCENEIAHKTNGNFYFGERKPENYRPYFLFEVTTQSSDTKPERVPCPSCGTHSAWYPSAFHLIADTIPVQIQEGIYFDSRNKIESWAKSNGRKFEEPGLNKDAKAKKKEILEKHKANFNKKVEDLYARAYAPTQEGADAAVAAIAAEEGKVWREAAAKESAAAIAAQEASYAPIVKTQ